MALQESSWCPMSWKNGAMALRWAAASFVETEKSYRRIIGYDQL